MERFKPFQGWVRDPQGDRPELVFPKKAREKGSLSIPQLVGFQTQEGYEVEVTREFALEVGLISEGMVGIARCGIKRFLEEHEKTTGKT